MSVSKNDVARDLSKRGAVLSCPRCNSTVDDMIIGDAGAVIKMSNDTQFPAYMVLCKRCGFVMFHTLQSPKSMKSVAIVRDLVENIQYAKDISKKYEIPITVFANWLKMDDKDRQKQVKKWFSQYNAESEHILETAHQALDTLIELQDKVNIPIQRIIDWVLSSPKQLKDKITTYFKGEGDGK